MLNGGEAKPSLLILFLRLALVTHYLWDSVDLSGDPGQDWKHSVEQQSARHQRGPSAAVPSEDWAKPNTPKSENFGLAGSFKLSCLSSSIM